jgi:two-component system, cell cycle sensor histidine kinase and response regulator CckA
MSSRNDLTVDQLREMAELGRDAFALFAADGRRLFATSNFQRVTRQPAPARLGEQLFRLIPTEEHAAARELVLRCKGAAGAASGTLHVLDDEGNANPVEFLAKRVTGGPSGTVYAVCAHRAAAATLSLAERRLAAIVQSSDDAIIGKALDGTITNWNDGAERLYGYSAAEAIGRNIAMLAPPDRPDEIPSIMASIAQGEVVSHLDTKRTRKDGSLVHVLLSVSPLRNPSGTLVGASVVARDMTRLKAAERALERTEEQLRQAQKMEAVGRLAGGVAHDFNNVLSVILTCGSFLLADLPEHHPSLQDVRDLLEAGERAATLTRQLLAFSRQQVLEPRVVDVNQIVRDVEKILRRVLGEDIDLALRLKEPIGKVIADPSQIEQVILNLVVNARDAMPRGGKLTIDTRNVVLDDDYVAEHLGAKPGLHVALAVSDTGEGMDAATLARIFDPFFTTKGPGRGTGLGLSTVDGIVAQSGGTVWVYSEPGRGTTFKIYLPHTDQAATGAGDAAAARASSGSETILLVEDEPKVRALARAILQRKGYTVLEAADGAQALAIYDEHARAIDLLLTDVVMPRMSGREVAERLAALQPGLRVLFMSGYTDDAIVHHGVLEAEVAFVQKPITPDSLSEKVRAVLDAPVK